jgi:hypothetical protein
MESQEPRLNQLTIRVPSERISEDLRFSRDPWEHSTLDRRLQGEPLRRLQGNIYFGMCLKEYFLLDKAFQTTLGNPDPYPKSPRAELLDSLSADYEFYGLATGRKQTEEIVRDLEAAAKAQAEAYLGKGRG